MNNITLISSVFLHVVLAFERYLAVFHPHIVYGMSAKVPQKMSAETAQAIRKKVRSCLGPNSICGGHNLPSC